MKDVIILGAGVGSRLRPLTNDVPKLLVTVAGKTILDRALDVLDADSNVETITVVLGYKSSSVREKLSGRSKVRLVYNHSFAQTNNMHSLHLALSTLSLKNDVVLMNGDCVYEPSVLKEAASATGNHIFADSAYPINDESMKIDIAETGAISAIAKKLSFSGSPMVSIDLYAMDAATAKSFYHVIDGFQSKAIRDQWVEVALDSLLKQPETVFTPKDINGRKWMEIDNHDDLEAANARFQAI